MTASPASSPKSPALPYAPGDRVFPSPSDDDLWRTVWLSLSRAYPERALMEQVRWAFEAVCEEESDHMSCKDFLRKVRLKWMWKRPPLPRGMAHYDFEN